jgi:hypothetical protein
MKILKICMLFISAALFFPAVAVAYDQQSTNTVYKYLAKKWVYYDIDGKKITVSALSTQWGSSGGTVLVNGKSIDPASVYDKSGRSIINPAKRNNAEPVIIIGKEPGVLRGITEAHNKKRRITGGGLPDLVWDEDIAAYAQAWANHLQQQNDCRMQHRSGADRQRKYGENLAWSGGMEMDPDSVVGMWYDEIQDYDYNTNRCRGVCGHYTQVVWKTSRKVGCGMATCGRSEVWVCNYDPPGNWIGEKPY